MLTKFFKLYSKIKKIKPRITPVTAFFMVLFGVIVDLLQLGLDAIVIGVVINPFIDLAAMPLTLYLWFKINRVSLGKPVRFIPMFIATALETFFLGAIPLWTIDILINIGTSWAEDVAAQGGEALAETIPGGVAAKPLLKGAVSNEATEQAEQAKREEREEEDAEADAQEEEQAAGSSHTNELDLARRERENASNVLNLRDEQEENDRRNAA
ncbi:MAG: hypothetical protein PHV42_02015 [Candidatus Pacebacteria bacterium]|nr:hypothetical protein [Candidatus Paceibacterota bacterium]